MTQRTLTSWGAAIAFSALGASPAWAAGLAEPAIQPVVAAPPPPAASTDWTGAYAGLQVGTITDGNYDSAGFSAPIEGEVYGAFGGYRRDFGNVVIGGEFDYMIGDATVDTPSGLSGLFDAEITRLTRIGVQVGYDAGSVLIYGTAGYADLEFDLETLGTGTGSGPFYGLGADFMASERITVGAELLKHDFEDIDGFPADGSLDLVTAGINIAYRF